MKTRKGTKGKIPTGFATVFGEVVPHRTACSPARLDLSRSVIGDGDTTVTIPDSQRTNSRDNSELHLHRTASCLNQLNRGYHFPLLQRRQHRAVSRLVVASRQGAAGDTMVETGCKSARGRVRPQMVTLSGRIIRQQNYWRWNRFARSPMLGGEIGFLLSMQGPSGRKRTELAELRGPGDESKFCVAAKGSIFTTKKGFHDPSSRQKKTGSFISHRYRQW
jgi:hypothetical protein